jgi:uncharacterized protein YjbJ (UPF0337 family)
MNKHTIAGSWLELKGKVKEKWGKLTDDDLTAIDGKREVLLGRLEKRYGYAKERAEEELAKFEKSCGCGGKSCSHRDLE